MAPSKTKKIDAPRRSSPSQPKRADEDLDRLEFHRHALALMPSAADRYPAVAYVVAPFKGRTGQRFCACKNAGRNTCHHLKQLAKIEAAFSKTTVQSSAVVDFKASFWYQLAVVLTHGGRPLLENIHLMQAGSIEKGEALFIQDQENCLQLIYVSMGPDRQRFVERCTLSREKGVVPTRADVLHQLTLLTTTADEEVLQAKGFTSARQLLEGSFWYRFAYHCFREFGTDRIRLHPFIDDDSGDFLLAAKDKGAETYFHLPVPRRKVKRVLKELGRALTNEHDFAIQPLSLDAVFDVTLNDALDMEIRPLHRLIRRNGELQFFRREDLEKYKYGDLYFIKELGLLVEDHPQAQPPGYLDPVQTLVRKSQIPHFLADHGADLLQPLFHLDESVQKLKILDAFESLVITPETIDRDWCWLSGDYHQGDISVSLADIIQAKLEGQRFVATGAGWVDCQAAQFDYLEEIARRSGPGTLTKDGQQVRLSRPDIFRLVGGDSGKITLDGDAQNVSSLHHLLDLSPTQPLPPLTDLKSTLRAYQQRGTQWLWFLYENRLGGLLCDDMGLGKTHQVMGLAVAMKAAGAARSPMLVVCPTSVLSHWQQKIVRHAPDLTIAEYYGGERDLSQARHCDVMVTSYGVLRRDIEAMAAMTYAVAVFDEIQHIKNAHTQSYAAAERLSAEIKIGLTGTPIENGLQELKALMDLVVPDYLGSDKAFDRRFRIPIEEHKDAHRRRELRRLISPFTLRRMKNSVLDELPEKIEDIRSCRLSEEQVKLYRDAIESRGRELLGTLNREEQSIPYMHIFALLTLLKQICNHPALVAKQEKDYGQHMSGKWELFIELLSEALDSGLKVVVYSQYVGMINIIKHYLSDENIRHVALTGASRNRGRIITQFNEDPACRVFIGSLKAGGVGIDLVAASVVIHYDRWWNAAREDQATDRVHRIGQTRGVQVFKLVTQGTLEEKIAAIINKKKDLMDSIVKEDDPNLVKTFSRSDLMEMLAMPDGGLG